MFKIRQPKSVSAFAFPWRALRNLARHFRDGESGAVTVESILWVCFFASFFALIVDASLIFHHQAGITRVVHDANRAFSLGRLESTGATETWVRDTLGNLSDQMSVSTQLNGDVITTIVAVPASDLMAVGLINTFSAVTVTIASSQFKEF